MFSKSSSSFSSSSCDNGGGSVWLPPEISIDEPLKQDGDGNELLLSDILGTDPDVTSRRIEDEVDRSLLRDSIGKLNNRERNIMELIEIKSSIPTPVFSNFLAM